MTNQVVGRGWGALKILKPGGLAVITISQPEDWVVKLGAGTCAGLHVRGRRRARANAAPGKTGQPQGDHAGRSGTGGENPRSRSALRVMEKL